LARDILKMLPNHSLSQQSVSDVHGDHANRDLSPYSDNEGSNDALFSPESAVIDDFGTASSACSPAATEDSYGADDSSDVSSVPNSVDGCDL
jgi:hypothetical protein